jgi:hypothetical protein
MSDAVLVLFFLQILVAVEDLEEKSEVSTLPKAKRLFDHTTAYPLPYNGSVL